MRLFKWLDFRAGATNYWVWSDKYENDYNGQNRTNSGSWVDVYDYLGAGMHWGSLEIDAAVDPEFINNGPYFISGDYTSSMFWRVSMLYWFD